MTKPQLINLQTAGTELSPSAFRSWVRLIGVSQERLNSRRKTAHEIGYSVRRSNEILRELAEKGYIRFELGANKFSPTKVVPIRPQEVSRPLPKAPTTKSAHYQKRPLPKAPTAASNPPSNQPSTQNIPPTKAPGSPTPPAKINSNLKVVPPKTKRDPPRKRKVLFTAGENTKVKSPPGEAVSVGGSGGGSLKALNLIEDPNKLKDSVLTPDNTPRRGALTRTRKGLKNREDPPREAIEKPSPAVDLDKISLAAEASKAKRSERNKAARRRAKSALPSGEMLGQELGQDESLPNATFTPGPKQRVRMVEILARVPGDLERRKLARGLGDSFRRIYTKYRRRFQAGYQCVPTQYRFAERAAVLCVMLEVKPADLIAYWAKHVGDFTSMKYPSLSFLSASGNVDQVACMRGACAGNGGKQEKAGKPCEVDSMHSYADTSQLDPRLRPGLLGAGFDLTGIDDRYLMTVQGAAQAIADGWPMYVSGKMKPWVDWAAEHVYEKEAVGSDHG